MAQLFGAEPPGALVVWSHPTPPGPNYLVSWAVAAPAGHVKLLSILNAIAGNVPPRQGPHMVACTPTPC